MDPEAWIACSSGADDASRFGILDMFGKWFIRGNTLRDVASLNKVELLPWDVWGAAQAADRADVAPGDDVIRAVAESVVSALVDDDVAANQRIYADDQALAVPATVPDARCDEMATVPT